MISCEWNKIIKNLNTKKKEKEKKIEDISVKVQGTNSYLPI